MATKTSDEVAEWKAKVAAEFPAAADPELDLHLLEIERLTECQTLSLEQVRGLLDDLYHLVHVASARWERDFHEMPPEQPTEVARWADATLPGGEMDDGDDEDHCRFCGAVMEIGDREDECSHVEGKGGAAAE